jgi:Family of unknown function (DUF5765)
MASANIRLARLKRNQRVVSFFLADFSVFCNSFVCCSQLESRSIFPALRTISELTNKTNTIIMCFSGEMSAGFAFICFALGGIVWAAGRPKRLAIAMAYFGLMELLQTVQYKFVAVPEDNFEMCKSPTNQYLTFVGLVHILFQPYFANMALCATGRQMSLKLRYMNDMVLRLCLLFAGWCLCRYLLAVYWPSNPAMAPRSTEACPNYEWVRDGYDAGIGWDTPNLPGHSCTFISNTTTGHIAWAAPLYQATYFVPGASMHFFRKYPLSLFHRFIQHQSSTHIISHSFRRTVLLFY